MSAKIRSTGESAPDGLEPAPRSAPPKAASAAGDLRQERLAQALRDNLKKRKAQQRRRQDGGT